MLNSLTNDLGRDRILFIGNEVSAVAEQEIQDYMGKPRKHLRKKADRFQVHKFQGESSNHESETLL
jgi:hypothetical protein